MDFSEWSGELWAIKIEASDGGASPASQGVRLDAFDDHSNHRIQSYPSSDGLEVDRLKLAGTGGDDDTVEFSGAERATPAVRKTSKIPKSTSATFSASRTANRVGCRRPSRAKTRRYELPVSPKRVCRDVSPRTKKRHVFIKCHKLRAALDGIAQRDDASTRLMPSR